MERENKWRQKKGVKSFRGVLGAVARVKDKIHAKFEENLSPQ